MVQYLNSIPCFISKSSFEMDFSYVNENLELNSPKMSFISDEFPFLQSNEDFNDLLLHESEILSNNENLSDFLENKSNIPKNEKILGSNINLQNIFKTMSKEEKNNIDNYEEKFLNKTIISSNEISEIQNEDYKNDFNLIQSLNFEQKKQKIIDFLKKDENTFLNKKREKSNFVLDSIKNDQNKKNKIKNCYSDKKTYICECGKKFSTKENKKLHYINVHLNKKPYRCDYCFYEFSHRNGKKYHERVFHTFIFPYNCKDCLMSFASNSALNYHIKTKHRKL